MAKFRIRLAALLALSVYLIPLGSTAAPAVPAPQFSLTWIAVTTWLIETNGQRILVDGYLTRPEPFANPGDAAGSFRPLNSDAKTVEAVISAVTHGDNRIDYILVGHTHYDHSLDVPLIAQRTGATIIGSPSACFQALGQGVPSARCKPVNGGEVIKLGSKGGLETTLYAIHGNHSGEGDSVLHVPLELSRPITVSPPMSATGDIRPGVQEQMPNGGGTRAFLIKTAGRGGAVSLSVETSGSPSDFDQPIKVLTCVGDEPAPCRKTVPGPTFQSPASAFAAALKTSGLSHVDLMIAMGGGGPQQGDPSASLTAKEANLLHPRFLLPTHWNNSRASILKGLDRPYRADPGMVQWLTAHGTTMTWPSQLLDRWVLDSSGLRPVENHAAKAALGLADVQAFPDGGPTEAPRGPPGGARPAG